MKKGYTTVSVPIALAEKMRKRLKGTGFASLSSFVEYVLRLLIEEEGRGMTDADITEVKRRLKKLGYA